MQLKLHNKMLISLASIMLLLIAIIVLAGLVSFRSFSIQAATEQTRTAAEIIRVTLTEAMLNGTILTRDSLLERIAKLDKLEDARVVRGPLVKQQYGPGLQIEKPLDAIDIQVLNSGQPVFTLENGYFSANFRATLPFIASRHGDVDCLNCHAVPEGTVLGAVTLSASVHSLRSAALFTLAALVGVVLIFAAISLLFLRYLLQPLVTTTREIEYAVYQAQKGNFSIRVKQRSQDEIGAIAKHFNSLSEGITTQLSQIQRNVAQLFQAQAQPNSNLLDATAELVASLVKIAQFKQAIEEDESSAEVFQRLSEVLQDEFGIQQHSIYAIDTRQQRLEVINVDGNAAAPLLWCNADILEQPQACRALRTGHSIDGSDNPHLCRFFAPEAKQEGWHYLCLPMVQAGSISNVFQLVFPTAEAAQVSKNQPLIEAYLREAAPVIQAKQLMEHLKESTLNDSMTGLRNRRFLEEYADTLISQCKRRGTAMTLIMLDLDYFKKVNDTYGHDIGDLMLIELAQILKAQVRDSDWIIRYGGEEFLIILLDTPASAGYKVAEKIRLAVANHQFKVGKVVLHKTLSAGVADFPGDAQAFWQALKYADVALYAAKNTGRNQVVSFTPDLWHSTETY